MITMCRQLLGLGFVAASSLLALHSAKAMSGPSGITIDGGPLGPLSLSGGFDGYGYVLSNTPNGVQDSGANIGSAMIELQKTTGQLQFTLEVGSSSYQTLGALSFDSRGKVSNTSTNTYITGPLYLGYATFAPKNMPFTISAGQLPSLEGYEAATDWSDPSQFTTAIFYVQNSNARGVMGTLTEGPVAATVEFGDGYDSGVWNYLQALVTYTINDNNVLNVYGGFHTGTTGPNSWAYGGTTTGLGNAYVNSNIIGAYYSYTMGNLNLVPEVQYQYAKEDAKVGIMGPANDLGAAVFADYTIPNSPYSIGGWVEYYTSHSSAAANYGFAFGPNAQAIGVAVSPTWQYKDLFARANLGYLYLLHNTDALGNKFGYGTSGTERGQFMGTLEAGVLF